MDQKKDFSQYEDMLYLKRPVSRSHLPMDIMERAAQFSPFAALTGYGDAVKETARQTERKQELDEYEKAALDEQLHELEAQMRGGELSRQMQDGHRQQNRRQRNCRQQNRGEQAQNCGRRLPSPTSSWTNTKKAVPTALLPEP